MWYKRVSPRAKCPQSLEQDPHCLYRYSWRSCYLQRREEEGCIGCSRVTERINRRASVPLAQSSHVAQTKIFTREARDSKKPQENASSSQVSTCMPIIEDDFKKEVLLEEFSWGKEVPITFEKLKVRRGRLEILTPVSSGTHLFSAGSLSNRQSRRISSSFRSKLYCPTKAIQQHSHRTLVGTGRRTWICVWWGSLFLCHCKRPHPMLLQVLRAVC